MKKLVFAFLSLALLSSFVFAIQSEKDISGYGTIGGNYVEASFKFMKGWNLVHGFPNQEWLSGGNISSANIKAIYGFNPLSQEYIRFYPQPDQDKLGSSNTSISSMISATAFWVYLDYPEDQLGQSEYFTLEPNVELNSQLLQGYNFVSILPNFINKTFDQLKGSCNIQKMYWWQPRSQSFNNILSDKDRMEVLRYSENIGSGLVIKVSESCKLFTESSSSAQNPPIIPNIKECTDSDGGNVIDTRGTTGDLSTTDKYNDVCFIRESATETTSTQECSGANCYLKEYGCESRTGNPISIEISCEEREFTSCKNGVCIN